MTPTRETRALLSWLDAPATDRGIRFAGADEEWDFWSYERLARLTRRVASGMIDAGVPPGSVVTVVQRSSPRFVATLFGAMLAGCTPSPAAPPLTFQDTGAYRDHLAGLLHSARTHTLVADTELLADIGDLAARTGVAMVTDVETLIAGSGPDRARHPAGLALLQFTSGSSGAARGVRVPFPALEANVAAIRSWLAMTRDDPTASWLPAHHDMGLIGCLLTPVVNGSDIWLMHPEQFIHRPLRFVRCFGELGVRLTAMPNFGLSYIARRVRPEEVRGFDLTQWRAVIVGAERLDAAAFEAFHRLLAPQGLTRRAVLPAYGLAESTLAVTGLALEEDWTRLTVAPEALALGRRIEPRDGGEGQDLIGCGRPLGGAWVGIRDEDGTPLPDGVVGEIHVGGPSLAAGYVSEQSGSSAFQDGTLRTGDAGFLRDGELYVLGRLGDSMKVRGRAVFAEDLETALAAVGVPPLRVAALLGERHGRPTAVALLEQPEPEWLREAAAVLARRAEGADVVILTAARGAITRTSSGKPRRRAMWRSFLGDRLEATVVADPGDHDGATVTAVTAATDQTGVQR